MADSPGFLREIIRQVFLQQGLMPPAYIDLHRSREMAAEVIEARQRELCHGYRYRILEWGKASEQLRLNPQWIDTNPHMYELMISRIFPWRNGIREIDNELKKLGTSEELFQHLVYGSAEKFEGGPHCSLVEPSPPASPH